jgi:hypothetical protein
MIQRRIERGEAKGSFIFTNSFDGERFKIQWWPQHEPQPQARKPRKKSSNRA